MRDLPHACYSVQDDSFAVDELTTDRQNGNRFLTWSTTCLIFARVILELPFSESRWFLGKVVVNAQRLRQVDGRLA